MKMLRFIFCAALFGCSDPIAEIVTSQKYQVVMPPDTMFECPLVKTFPDSKTLTDIEVAKLLVTYRKTNVQCYNNSKALKEFLDNAKKTVEADTKE